MNSTRSRPEIIQHSQHSFQSQKADRATNLAAVDLKVARRHRQALALVLRRLEQPEDILGRHGVDALVGVLGPAAERAAHGVGFAGARLAVGETRGHAAVEDRVHQGARRISVRRGGGLCSCTEGEGEWLSVSLCVGLPSEEIREKV